MNLINFDNTVNFPDKPIAGKKSNCSCEEEKAENHDTSVAKIQESRCRVFNIQLGEEVMNTINSKVESCKSTGQEAPPPPVVILSTQMKVTEKNGSLGASDDENHKDEKQKSVHVVDLTGPYAVENEEKLNEDASEGQNTSHDDTRDGLGVDGLVGNLSRDLVCPHWLLNCRFAETKVGSDKCEWNRDTEPESQESDQSEEGDGCRG